MLFLRRKTFWNSWEVSCSVNGVDSWEIYRWCRRIIKKAGKSRGNIMEFVLAWKCCSFQAVFVVTLWLFYLLKGELAVASAVCVNNCLFPGMLVLVLVVVLKESLKHLSAANLSLFSKLFCYFFVILVVWGPCDPLYPAWYIAFVFNCVAYYVFVLRCAEK